MLSVLFIRIFNSVYETLLPRRKLTDKPKPWRIMCILKLFYGCWDAGKELKV